MTGKARHGRVRPGRHGIVDDRVRVDAPTPQRDTEPTGWRHPLETPKAR